MSHGGINFNITIVAGVHQLGNFYIQISSTYSICGIGAFLNAQL